MCSKLQKNQKRSCQFHVDLVWNDPNMNLVEINLVVLRIQEVEFGKILVHVNNTLVLHATFLATQHTTMCLNGKFTEFIYLHETNSISQKLLKFYLSTHYFTYSPKFFLPIHCFAYFPKFSNTNIFHYTV